MRVEVFSDIDRGRFEAALNEMLKEHEGEDIEIQYQHCATQAGSGSWVTYFSAMVIFK